MKNLKYFIVLLMIGITANAFSQVIRKDYREFTNAERQAYLTAFDAIWDSSFSSITNIVERYRIVHGNVFPDIHDSDVDPHKPFLPWHREFLRQFELHLKSVDIDVTIPYWNWVEEENPTVASDAAIWGSSWLGPYSATYYVPIGRRLNGTLPADQSDLDVALNQTDFPSFTSELEAGTDLHNTMHGWISDAMANGGDAPREPAFSFAHGFIDKTWQDWVNSNYSAMQNWINTVHVGGQTGWEITTMPCGAGGINFIDPDAIWDSRALDIWYASNNLVILDKHTVFTDSPKTYKYTTGVIQAENGFIVPNGADCTFEGNVDHEIAMLPGFGAEEGSEFSAIVQ